MLRVLRAAAFVGVWAGSCMLCTGSNAGDLESPTGPVILSIGGDISFTNAGDEAHFDRPMLEELGLVVLRTETPWTDGKQTFEGVPVERILDAVGANGTVARAKALNDYVVDIDISFVVAAKAMVAVKTNGVYMGVRDKGPLWIVFPWDQQPELDEEFVKSQSVWQFNRLEIR